MSLGRRAQALEELADRRARAAQRIGSQRMARLAVNAREQARLARVHANAASRSDLAGMLAAEHDFNKVAASTADLVVQDAAAVAAKQAIVNAETFTAPSPDTYTPPATQPLTVEYAPDFGPGVPSTPTMSIDTQPPATQTMSYEAAQPAPSAAPMSTATYAPSSDYLNIDAIKAPTPAPAATATRLPSSDYATYRAPENAPTSPGPVARRAAIMQTDRTYAPPFDPSPDAVESPEAKRKRMVALAAKQKTWWWLLIGSAATGLLFYSYAWSQS